MTAPIKLHDYQEATKQFMVDHPKCAVFLPMGLGKDQPLDALVLTPSGFRTMGEMAIGTEVVVPSGGTALVDGVFPQGVRPVYELTLDDGRTVRAGRDHLWSVLDQEGYASTMSTAELRALKDGDSRYIRDVHPDTGAPLEYTGGQRRIISIEYVGEEHTQCISVDHPDHEYVTDQFVRTHNTLVTLSTLAEVRPSGHILVIAPLNIVRSTWIDEIEKWGFPVRTKSLIVNERGNKLSRKKRLERYAEIATDPPTMYFINQDLVDDLVQNMPTQRVSGRKTFVWPFGTVIIDESQGLKNPSSKRFKALKRVAPATTRIIEMTGTPTPNGLLDLWSQIYLLDEGLALGRTFTQYRERYFRPTQYVNNRPVKWELLPGAEQEIYQRISHLVMSIENTALTLPPLTVNDVRVHLADKEQELYEEMKRELVLTFTDKSSGSQEHVTAPNAGVLAARLIQIASGTIYTGPNHKHEVIHNQKIEHCDYILRNTTSPTIIAYRFVSDREQLLKQLRDRGYDVRVFDGSREMIKQWNERKIQVMLLQPASAGHGLNLQQGGSSMIWYTLPWSLEHYAQTNARLHRQGQKDPVVIHRLITQKTFDTRLPKILENKDGVQQGLMDAVLMEVGATDLGAPLSNAAMHRMVDEDWLDYIEDYGVDDSDRF